MTPQLYNDYGAWIRSKFPFRVQKISIDAGFACPNRDGHVGIGGCTFCDNRTFNPSYCQPSKSIAEQISEGKAFFARKYTGMKYLAYFQAYSNTYASVETLKRRYEEALSQEDVVGIIIGTRPDCAGSEVMDYLEQLNRQTFMIVEYGIESVSGQDVAARQPRTRLRVLATCPCRDSRPWHNDVRTCNIRIAGRIG